MQLIWISVLWIIQNLKKTSNCAKTVRNLISKKIWQLDDLEQKRGEKFSFSSKTAIGRSDDKVWKKNKTAEIFLNSKILLEFYGEIG